MRRTCEAGVLLVLAMPIGLPAQVAPATAPVVSETQRVLASWQQLAAPTGHEKRAIADLAAALAG